MFQSEPRSLATRFYEIHPGDAPKVFYHGAKLSLSQDAEGVFEFSPDGRKMYSGDGKINVSPWETIRGKKDDVMNVIEKIEFDPDTTLYRPEGRCWMRPSVSERDSLKSGRLAFVVERLVPVKQTDGSHMTKQEYCRQQAGVINALASASCFAGVSPSRDVSYPDARPSHLVADLVLQVSPRPVVVNIVGETGLPYGYLEAQEYFREQGQEAVVLVREDPHVDGLNAYIYSIDPDTSAIRIERDGQTMDPGEFYPASTRPERTSLMPLVAISRDGERIVSPLAPAPEWVSAKSPAPGDYRLEACGCPSKRSMLRGGLLAGICCVFLRGVLMPT